MAEIKLDFLIIPTYSLETLGVADNSIYPDVSLLDSLPEEPVLIVTVPGYDPVEVPFVKDDFIALNSTMLGLSEGTNFEELPDGIYTIKYLIKPDLDTFVEKSFMRVEVIQEKFDIAFLKLQMMECDRSIKKQSKIDLDSIYYFIQGAIASANNCMICESNKLYEQANSMLKKFTGNTCGC